MRMCSILLKISIPLELNHHYIISRAGRKILPAATRGVKRILNSDLVKDVGNTLVQQGVEAATDVVSNLIEGKEDPLEGAKERLQETRKEIANTIRKRKIIPIESKSDIVKPKRKKKEAKIKKRKKKKYNLFEDFEDV